MKKQTIQIRIKKDGSYTLEAKEGFAGQSCREKTKHLELMLGGEAVDTENTTAFYDNDDDDMNLNLNF
jgi:hypothetical protein